MTNFKIEDLIEKKVSSQLAYDGKYLQLFHDEVELSNGHLTAREYLRHPGAVCILAINEHNQIALERQFRYPFSEIFWEVPAGKLNSKDEDHLLAAQRELLEETGLRADSWQEVGKFCPTIAYSDEIIYMYIASQLSQGERKLDEDELLNVEMIDFDEAVRMVMDNTITDGKSQTIILKAYQLLHK